MSKRVVIVTGGCGFVGRHALKHLVAKKFEVHVITRQKLSRAARSKVAGGAHSDVFFHEAMDLHDTDSAAPRIREIKATHLLHLAWDVRHGLFWNSTENLDWIVTSKLLVQDFIAQGGYRIVAAGTCAEYDWSSGEERFFESSSKVHPISMYGQCKLAFRKSLGMLCEHHKVSAAWGRIFFLFGPYEDPKRLVSSAVRALLKGEEFPASTGDQVRDFMYVEDVARGFVELLDSQVEGDVNIASGQPSSVAEILTLLGDITGRPELVKLGAKAKQQHEPERLVASVDRLNQEVGSKAMFSLIEGLRATVEWWQEVERDAERGGQP